MKCLYVLILVVWLVRIISPVSAQDEDSRPIITPENADQITQLAWLGRGWLHKLAWSPDGTQLAVAASNGVFLYNTADWDSPPRVLPGYERAAMNVAWSPGGDQLVYVDAQGYARLWDIAAGSFIERTENLVPPTFIEGGEFYYRDDRHRASARSVMFDEQGTVFMVVAYNTGGCEGECIWDATHGRYLVEGVDYQVIQDIAVFPNYTILDMSTRPSLVSPNGLLVADAICGWDREECSQGVIALYDSVTGSTFKEILTPHIAYDHENITRLAFSPDSQQIAAGGCVEPSDPGDDPDGCARFRALIYDVATGEEAIRLDGDFINAIESIEYSPNGTLLAAADSTSFYIWDVSTGERLATVDGYGGPVTFLAFHPTGEYFLSGHFSGYDRSEALYFWNEQSWATGEPMTGLSGTGPFAFDTDGTTLFAGNMADYWYGDYSTAAMWNITDPAAPKRLNYPDIEEKLWNVISLTYRDDIGLLATPVEGHWLVIWNPQTNDLLEVNINTGESALALSGDNIALVSPPYFDIFETSTILNWTPETHPFDNPDSYIELTWKGYLLTDFEFSPDGRLFAIVGFEYGTEAPPMVRIWKVPTWNELPAITNLPATRLDSLAFSPDNSLLAAGGCSQKSESGNILACDEGGIWLIDTSAFTVMAQLEGHTDVVQALAFSPDGSLLVSGSGDMVVYDTVKSNDDNRIRVWGIPTN